MLKLFSNTILPLGETSLSGPGVFRLAEDASAASGSRFKELFVVRKSTPVLPEGFGGYVFFEKPLSQTPANSFLFERDLSYVCDGDIVKLDPRAKSARVLYRKQSRNNFFLLTERCNNFCLMCSQPPKDRDDSYIIQDVLDAIPLMSPESASVGLTGGEPTLLGNSLIAIITRLKEYLPKTAVHILSNGRAFKAWNYARDVGAIRHHDLMMGIPLYSDIASTHDYVVQAKGAFDDTVRGILNLKSVGVPVEVRVVLHKLTYERLPELALFLRRNLIFCDHVAFMGLEITGFTKINLEKLWIDPKDYQPQLKEAVSILHRAKMQVSIYNLPLCVLDPEITTFSRRSISDWKNEFLPECEPCTAKNNCAGFFSTSRLRRTEHIKPFIA